MRISDWSSDVSSSDLEVQRHALGAEQRRILLGKTGLGLAENTDEILFGKRAEFDADGEATLEFGEQVAWLGDMEGARGYKENMVGFHRAIRWEERRVGEGCVGRCRYRCAVEL